MKSKWSKSVLAPTDEQEPEKKEVKIPDRWRLAHLRSVVKLRPVGRRDGIVNEFCDAIEALTEITT